MIDALVVVVDSDGEGSLGALLPDHILVEDLLDPMRLGKLVTRTLGAILELLPNDVVAKLDALVTDEDGWTGDELTNFVLTLPAERTVKKFSIVVAAAGIFTHR
jgi:hypothetical protein